MVTMSSRTQDDDDLTRRILITLSLVLLIDVLFVLLIGVLLSPWLTFLRSAVANALGLGTSPLIQWTVVLVPAVVVFVWAQLRYTRNQVLSRVDAHEVAPEEAPDLHDRIGRLAQQAEVAKPTVAIAETDVPNSFTVGTPADATVVVSRGLLEELDGEQFDAVLAHEVAHIKNRDATVMTMATFLPALVNEEFSVFDDLLPGDWNGAGPFVWGGLLLVLFALSTAFIGGPVFSVEFLVVFAIVVVLTVLFGGVALGVLATPVVFLSRNLSQYREYAADRAGAVMTGDPGALADALKHLDEDADGVPTDDAREVHGGVAGLCLLPYGLDGRRNDDEFHIETRSHPSVEDRIQRLGRLAAEMETRH